MAQTTTTTPLLLADCTREALRRKLTDAASPLAPWWGHLQTLARRDPVWYSPYTVLAALVTDAPDDRERARRAMLRLVELKDEGDTSLDAQAHTHVTAAPLGRWAVYYDWLSELSLFTPEEDAAIRAAMLDHAFTFPLQGLQARMRSFDNQIMSNAFSATMVGYVCGLKRGNSALGRRLFNTGLLWLQELLRLLPAGGYSPEGSTYHEYVVQPLTLLAARMVQEMTGEPVFTAGLPPTHRPVRELLDISYRMIGPGGLLPAWDAYGFQAASVKAGLTYLARLTGDPGPLNTIRGLNLWYRSALVAWEVDDRLWTLVWWPEGVETAAEPGFMPWLSPAVAGAVQEAPRQIRLFQYWDECGGVPNAGRSQVDPNAVTLEAFGSPLLLDGSGHPGRDLLPIPVDTARAYVGARTLETIQEYIHSAWGAVISDAEALDSALNGAVGMANSLVLDGEDWYVPREPRVGAGEALHGIGPLQVIRGNATAFYTDRYDVAAVTRASALIGGRYAVVTDMVHAATPHAVTWQAYLRPAVQLCTDRAVIVSPEQVRCDIIPLTPGDSSLTPAPDYPKSPAGGSVLFRHAVPPASATRLDTALIPQSCLAFAAEVSEGWTRTMGGTADTVSLTDAYLSDTGDFPDALRSFTRTIVWHPLPERRYFLTLAIANPAVALTVNGQEIAPTQQQPSSNNWQNGAMLHWTFELTPALHDGENAFCFSVPYFHGETLCGPARLYADATPAAVRVARTGPAAFAVTIGEETDELLLENDGLTAWAGGKTDARYAARMADGRLAAAEVTLLALPDGVQMESSAPCDVAWTPAETQVAHALNGTVLRFCWPGGHLLVECGGCLAITYQGARPHRLRLAVAGMRTVVVNGQSRGCVEAAEDQPIVIDLSAASPMMANPTTPEMVYALAETAAGLCGPALLTALESGDWPVQVAAADVIGRLGIQAAVPLLLARFAEGEAELPYPTLTKWWHWSKMLRNPGSEEGPDPDLPRPLGIKRWRVKRAVVTALGKLGDPRAVTPLETALTRGDDFFPVTAQLAVALGRLGAPSSIPVLARCYDHAEVNTRVHARLALALLRGEIDRKTFEAKIGGVG